MTNQHQDDLTTFLESLGLIEEPVGIFFTDEKPADGFSPKPMALPTREKEINNDIDWQATFSQFSCVMGHVLRARKLKKPAYFSAEQFGCPEKDQAKQQSLGSENKKMSFECNCSSE